MDTDILINALERLKGVPPPRAGEAQDEFYSRCMANPGMNEEYPDKDQRSAMCTARWQEPGNPSGADDEKAIALSEIVWDKIGLEKTEFLTTEQISQQIRSGIRAALREVARAQAQAAINRLTGRLD
jgi:hypothetical protein